MKRVINILLLCVFALAVEASASLSLQQVCQGWGYARGVYGVTPLMDGESYSSISSDRTQILQYSFRTGQQTGVLFDVHNTKGHLRLQSIDGYIMSPNEQHILIQTETHSIYRHSATAVYYIYNVRNRTLVPLSDNGPQEVPLWSKDGNQVAFVRDGNLFLVKLLFGNSESQVTKDGKFNEVINGKPDWVNEEEFSFNRAFDFNADGTMLAWIRYDESQVPLYTFPWYKGLLPVKEEYAKYPGNYEYKYPIAGEKNSTVTVHTFDIKSHTTRQMKLPLDPDGYIPRIAFTDDPEKLLILTQNRHQDRLDIYIANPRSTECRCIVRDQAERYITEEPYKNLSLHPGGFVLMSERSGYNHLYLYDFNGTLKRQLTRGDFMVTDYYGYDAANGMVYYASTKESPMQRAIYKCDAKGKEVKLSSKQGTNSAIFSRSMRYYMNTFSNLNTPTEVSLCDNSGKQLCVIENNEELRQRLASTQLGTREFFRFKTQDGVELNGLMVKPANFNPAQKYPVVMFQYSGPGSQQVVDSWSAGNMGGCMYEQYLAQEGFICVIVDGRGTGGRGRDFEQCTYLHLGQLESHDQVEAAIFLGSLPYVDAKRIGIWGWSFGGFNTLMSMSEGRPVFAAGVAVAAPTSWRFYDSVYTERFMRTPAENKEGYDVSPVGLAHQLNGRLLICHGTADDNVHLRNLAEYTEALVQADKDFMELTYTNRNHGISGGNTRIHLFRNITNWFKANL